MQHRQFLNLFRNVIVSRDDHVTDVLCGDIQIEPIWKVEQEIRALPANDGLTTDQIDFSVLNNFHVESSGLTPETPSATATLDWTLATMSANDASVLSSGYMQTILTGLNGGNPSAPDGAQDSLITSGEFIKIADSMKMFS